MTDSSSSDGCDVGVDPPAFAAATSLASIDENSVQSASELHVPLLHRPHYTGSSVIRQRANHHPNGGGHHHHDEFQDEIDEEESLSPQSQSREQQRRTSRILDRNAAFHQSRGRWGVERRNMGDVLRSRRRWYCCCFGRFWTEWILAGDWFHRLAYTRTCDLMMILFTVYCAIVVFFAFVYYGVSMLGQETQTNPDGTKKIIAFCDMEINDHMEALYFSLSTMTTIGYGVSDYYFGGCWTPLLLVLWQVCSSILFTAVATGLLFQRIARGRKRGKTIAFSDKALIQRVKGVPYLMFRIGEMRSYHLMEATVRCYCIRHERLPVGTTSQRGRGRPPPPPSRTSSECSNSSGNNDSDNASPTPTSERMIETTYFLSRQVKLLQPDEAYGSTIWMGLPQVVVHRLDLSSPLVPPSPVWYDEAGHVHSYPKKKYRSGANHSRFSSSDNEHEDGEEDDEYYINDLAEVEKFLLDREAEIVVLVEGTDEGTGAPTQARHSYKSSDLAWNHTFVPCVFPYSTNRNRRRRRRIQSVNNIHGGRSSSRDPVCSIDFMRFHDSVEVPANSDACAYIPNAEC